MFELSVAWKYLHPRWRQLSVSIISLVSVLVIALVVWLIVVFFSVKDGLENSWVDKVIALTAPIRITPTKHYYNSYYYLADTISSQSDYSAKSIGEKLIAVEADPYDPSVDEELPMHWPLADRNADGSLKDLVKVVSAIAQSILIAKDVKISDYETTLANIHLRLVRSSPGLTGQTQQFLDHAVYVGSFDADSPTLAKALYPLFTVDATNLLLMQAISSVNVMEANPDAVQRYEAEIFRQRLKNLFTVVNITTLKPSERGWRLPLNLLPTSATFTVVAFLHDNDITRLILPAETAAIPLLLANPSPSQVQPVQAEITLLEGDVSIQLPGQELTLLPPWVPINLDERATLAATLDESSLDKAVKPSDIRFNVKGNVQGRQISGNVALGRLEIAAIQVNQHIPTALFATQMANHSGIILPTNTPEGDGILLPRSFKEAGALVGDQGYLSYQSPTPSTIQEQRVPIFIAGFYDPGIMSMGGKYILAPKEITSSIRSAYDHTEVLESNGINMRFSNIKDAPKIKEALQSAFKEAGIAPYWRIQTYQEYEFTKDLIQQLQSEKNLFSVISLVIIIVACSNIISMLIILVNDKKLEIGILRSMGATSSSIAVIFGLCGMVMGTAGSILGIAAATITLRYINELVHFIGRLQGHDLFNPIFYGTTLPGELSFEALSFVIMTTAFISLLAGIVPAVKASMMRPSAILKSE